MKKQDLKSGMYIEFECGNRRLILLNTHEGDVMSNIDTNYGDLKRLVNFFELDNLTEDLRDNTRHNQLGDIVKVYNNYAKLIWERPEENIFKIGNTVKNNKRKILVTKDGDGVHFGGVVLEDNGVSKRGKHSDNWTIIAKNYCDLYGDKYKKVTI